MQVMNIHQRQFSSNSEQVWALIESLSSPGDRLWPRHAWPKMEFDRPLGVGAIGGHGPVRYFVEEYVPGKSIRFRFTGPKGFNGFHGFDVSSLSSGSVLRHTLLMTAEGPAVLTWPLVFRPLHDALLEDCLGCAEESLGFSPKIQAWSPWVICLRWLLARMKVRKRAIQNIED